MLINTINNNHSFVLIVWFKAILDFFVILFFFLNLIYFKSASSKFKWAGWQAISLYWKQMYYNKRESRKPICPFSIFRFMFRIKIFLSIFFPLFLIIILINVVVVVVFNVCCFDNLHSIDKILFVCHTDYYR